MTANEPAWLDNGNGDLLRYDFYPPADWSDDRIAAEQLAIADAIDDAQAGASAPGWLRLARRLPAALRSALVAELRAGNRLAGIGSTDWPGEGSIVANLRAPLNVARRVLPAGVAWRRLDDPHHASEELSQKVGPVEFLIIA
jgi:hypothetical protein